MSYKTLILIDNNNELTKGNKDTIRETVKYIINNVSEDNQVAIAVTGEKAEYLTDYEDSTNTQIKTIESLEYTDDTAPGVDVLMDIILEWKSGDLANRDILYISGRSISFGSEYLEEELLFEVNGKEYPIYTLACVQNDNTSCIKNLNSLSRISGGECISTEDTVSDANVERQLGDMILAAMQDRRELDNEQYMTDELDNGYEEEDSYDDSVSYIEDGEYDLEPELSEADTLTVETGTENVIYEAAVPVSLTQRVRPYAIPALIILIVILVFAISIEMKNRRYKKEDERFKESFKDSNKRSVAKRAPFEEETSATVCLSDNSDVDTGTRLLYQTTEGVEITLEDRSNPTKYFRACVRDSLVIGRNEKTCDIAITYDDSVSSRHCELFLRDNNLYCRDLGSSNGTMINRQKVYQEIKLESGDILRIGRLSFFLQILGDSYE